MITVLNIDCPETFNTSGNIKTIILEIVLKIYIFFYMNIPLVWIERVKFKATSVDEYIFQQHPSS